MKTEVWLKIEGKKKYQSWLPGNVQAYKTKPSTNDREITVKVILEIPDEVFEEPVFEVKMTLPKPQHTVPNVSEVSKSVEKELSKQMGFKVKIEIPETVKEAK